ncbi:MAG: fluoride efflux transporter CrcB [Ferruginibacter sp.]|nr:fluoride efflux transporter CrcB [Ferruginibacter sp.]
MLLKNILWIGLGGALGSIARYSVSLLVPSKSFPYSTFLVNIIGCLAIGIFMALSLKNQTTFNNYKLFLTTGLCGGFTTFSAFAIENVQLFENGKPLIALCYIALSIVLGIAAAYIGYKLI